MSRIVYLAMTLCVQSASAITFLVTTNADSGPGSLRQAILDANATPGPDAIYFNIGSGFGPKSITVLEPLPTVTEAVEINGRTQPGYTNSPRVFLFGGNIAGSPALHLECTEAAVLGLSITAFAYGPAILISGGGSHLIAGNWIGTFTQDLGNANGIVVSNSHGNQIGLSHAVGTNNISNNLGCGILLSGSSSNVVEANLITGNGLDGVALLNGSTYNSIGGVSPNTGNLISGNQGNGIYASRSRLNVIEGNYIGCDQTGTSTLSNALSGIHLLDSPDTTIGGISADARNLIAGNAGHGIEIESLGSMNTVIQGNYIGVAADGVTAVSNRGAGIFLNASASNLIGGNEPGSGNLISGNFDRGILILNGGTNLVQGNLIGTDHTGTICLGNRLGGIAIGGSRENLIGGSESGARNIISGNRSTGVWVSGPDDNLIQGNYIGVNIQGVAAIPNSVGIFLGGGGGLVVGSHSAVSNVVSGNLSTGISLQASRHTVVGNFIGTDATGTKAIPNGGSGIAAFSFGSSTIGGPESESRNVISGNRGHGIDFASASGVVQGNYIGLNALGTSAIGNQGFGIVLASSRTTIGGAEPGAGNVISGNHAGGVAIGGGVATNVLHGNYIGTDSSGAFGVPNSGPGVMLNLSARYNQIGGPMANERNLIAFNTGDGLLVQSNAMGNAVQGNSIHSNGKLGINLKRHAEANGIVTPNDIGDADVGPNNLQNFPVITNVVYLTSSTIIQGYLRSSTNGSFSIDLYANIATERSGFGEGQFYLGNVDVDTDATGFTQFAFVASGTFSNQFFTATALNYDTADTSEFSAAMGGIRITSIERVASQYRVSFSTITNRTYVVQWASNLNSSMSWSPVVLPPQPIQGTGGIVTVSDNAPITGPGRVYRVMQQP